MTVLMKHRATGRRKKSVARIEIFGGSGEITVNGKSSDSFFPRETHKIIIRQPFVATDTLGKFDVRANVCGGGTGGQAGAVRLGISRALASIDENHKHILRKGGFLTRDPRAKERKKYGRKGARKRFQWTKR